MLDAARRRDLSRAVLTVCMSYALALQLIVAGLAGTAQAAKSFDALAPNPHILCLTGSVGGDLDRNGSTPASPYGHDLCGTFVCAGVVLLAPESFAVVAYATASLVAVHPTFDFDARPATAPPGLGRGPRAPPSDLV
jgi:hypothetical protein